MILFPNCKINLGLHITARRPDGYHEIETLFYPVPGLCDAVEILPDSGVPGQDIVFSSTGLAVDCPADKNLCVKAARLLREAFPERFAEVGGVRIHLYKHIPFGAGLGGGSADATAVLAGLNEVLSLGLATEELAPYAARLGSDTVFFLYNIPMLGTGRGERLEPFPGVDLKGCWLLLVKPDVGVSTAEAYSSITPRVPSVPLADTLRLPVESWRGALANDFEEPLFRKLPVLGEVKTGLYRRGAAYAAMSGSGSTLFGLFRERPDTGGWPVNYFTHAERL
ncbi:MAG: 4-(cytidine 5'-diphospho)-2-C-methyl-D-erythritol kinase [Rikenellaceae bacterium]|nr:4-(cytidine 5'-diphospho)-2-C-methyl-D-erythritol kinase [Rikenellaceae bacterium]